MASTPAGSAASQNPALAAAVGQGNYPMHGSPMPPQGPQVQASAMSHGSPAPPPSTSSIPQSSQQQQLMSAGNPGGILLSANVLINGQKVPSKIGLTKDEGILHRFYVIALI